MRKRISFNCPLFIEYGVSPNHYWADEKEKCTVQNKHWPKSILFPRKQNVLEMGCSFIQLNTKLDKFFYDK